MVHDERRYGITEPRAGSAAMSDPPYPRPRMATTMTVEEVMSMSPTKYRVHQFKTGLSVDKATLEQTLNSIDGEIVAIVPNVMQFPFARVNYLLIVERTKDARSLAA